MVRLTKQSAGTILYWLVYLQHRHPEAFKSLVESSPSREIRNLSAERRISAELYAKLFDAQGECLATTPDELYSSVLGQIDSDDRVPEILDALLSIVRNRYGASLLSDGTLRRIAQTLLDPSEASKLLSDLASLPLKCSHCGHEFVQGEIAVAVKADEAATFLCGNCVTPEYIACPNDPSHSVNIGSAIRDALYATRVACKKHSKAQPAAEVHPFDDVRAAAAAIPAPAQQPVRQRGGVGFAVPGNLRAAQEMLNRIGQNRVVAPAPGRARVVAFDDHARAIADWNAAVRMPGIDLIEDE